MGDCGIQGCKYNKLTPDGNKSFKCDYWKIASCRRNEAISLQLSSNNDLAVKALKGDLSFRRIIRELPFSESVELDSFNSSLDTTPSHAEKLDVNQDQESTLSNNNRETRQLGFDKSVETMVNELSVPQLFDQQAQVAIKKIIKVIQTTVPSLIQHVEINSNRLQNNTDTHQASVNKTDASALVMWNEVNRNRSKVQELEKRVKTLENQLSNKGNDEWLYLPDDVSIKDVHVTYNQLILYSKHIRRYFMTDDPGRPCFVVTKNRMIIKYLVKMFPGVFWFYKDYDYISGDKPKSLSDHNSRKFTDINIVPDFNFIEDNRISSVRTICFKNEKYEFKPKWFPLYAEFDTDQYFEARILDYLNPSDFNYKFQTYDEIKKKAEPNLRNLDIWMKRLAGNENFDNKFCQYDKISELDLK